MTQFWLNNPSVLMNKNNILNLWPTKNMSQTETINGNWLYSYKKY